MALYRKYRPATFAEVVGQEHVTEPLSTALDSGRVNHAYLFSGPRGCGKTSSARILARSLNCEQGPTSTPCGVCNSCVALAPGGPGNLDVTEMDAASHGGVDDARELRDRAFYAPAESRYRVFIVDEAHMVTPQGFNALLKIVEEPPEHLIFIFATTEPEKVLTTIRSRTHHYPFRLLAPNVMRPLLEKITGAEHVTVEPQVYPLVIRAGGGSPRDSLSIMDQLLAGAGPEGVTYQRALGLLGVTDTALIDAAVDALAAADGAALFGAVEKVMEAGHDPRRFATDLLERLRDLILLHTVPDAADRGLIDVPEDVLETMRGEAAKLGLATLTRCAEVTHASLAEMRGATSPRLLLEVMCARMLLPAADDSQAALLQRIEALERRPAGAPVDGAAPSVPATAAVPGAPGPATGSTPPSDGPPSRFVRPSQRQAEAPAESAPVAASAPAPAAPSAPEPVAPEPVAPAAVAAPAEPAPPSTPAEQEPAVAAEPEPAATADPAHAVESEPVLHRPEPDPEAVAPPRLADPVAPERAAEPAPQAVAAEPVPPATAEPTPTPAPPAPETATAPEPAPVAPAAQAPSGPSVDEVRTAWPKVLRAVKDRSTVTFALMPNVQVLGLAGDVLHLALPIPALLSRFSDQQHVGNLRDAVREVFGTQWNVEVGDGSARPQGASAAPAQQQRPSGEPRKAPPTFERRSRAGDQRPDPRPAGRENRAPSHHDDIPLPPEPDPEPAPVEEISEEEMIDAAHREDAVSGGTTAPRRDPDEIALELLKNELGARPI
ncbi:DNA polymerase III subunit gamma and tau [Tsukamurella ocularis]|uniref:DNA polymerase III subunit gamma and tau n=1 Tax=Tsukamurella ocularis TaxID=1970234 RepID=UPI002167EF5D|nr:DNA polymerase III subunit gamma and tau [Tsukamurella ocularis]MCS3779080.1 DNA polymerase-3 subunit gamma/tau [Tsukamurella ocularis]MCS3787300.1 DNA polymerase-3 subunit gamma/tau [Tsukamurella ocularis]MCS3851763.1 DNA polymerase-3 subunit gamma/tau [Tsukamurella ocularis]